MTIDTLIITKLLEELQGYIHDLETMNFTLEELESNRDIQHLTNHRLHTAVEIAIDIAMHVASALELPGRESAVDVIELLGTHKVLDKAFTQSFRRAPKLRNLLIHGYAKVDYSMLFRDLSADIADLKQFCRQIYQFIAKK